MALSQYMEMYNPDVHYGKTIVVLQSSGTGKSRTVAEMASSVCIHHPFESFVVANPSQDAREHWGIGVCFRGLGSMETPDAEDEYPLGDRSVFGCLDSLPEDVMRNLKFVKVSTFNYQLFVGVLTLNRAKRLLLLSWGLFLASCMTQSWMRNVPLINTRKLLMNVGVFLMSPTSPRHYALRILRKFGPTPLPH